LVFVFLVLFFYRPEWSLKCEPIIVFIIECDGGEYLELNNRLFTDEINPGLLLALFFANAITAEFPSAP